MINWKDQEVNEYNSWQICKFTLSL